MVFLLSRGAILTGYRRQPWVQRESFDHPAARNRDQTSVSNRPWRVGREWLLLFLPAPACLFSQRRRGAGNLEANPLRTSAQRCRSHPSHSNTNRREDSPIPLL